MKLVVVKLEVCNFRMLSYFHTL